MALAQLPTGELQRPAVEEAAPSLQMVVEEERPNVHHRNYRTPPLSR
jgi:hypothetical protein